MHKIRTVIFYGDAHCVNWNIATNPEITIFTISEKVKIVKNQALSVRLVRQMLVECLKNPQLETKTRAAIKMTDGQLDEDK